MCEHGVFSSNPWVTSPITSAQREIQLLWVWLERAIPLICSRKMCKCVMELSRPLSLCSGRYIPHTLLKNRLFINLSTWRLRPLPLYSVSIGWGCWIHRMGRAGAPPRYHAQLLLQRLLYLCSIMRKVFWTDTRKGVRCAKNAWTTSFPIAAAGWQGNPKVQSLFLHSKKLLREEPRTFSKQKIRLIFVLPISCCEFRPYFD